MHSLCEAYRDYSPNTSIAVCVLPIRPYLCACFLSALITMTQHVTEHVLCHVRIVRHDYSTYVSVVRVSSFVNTLTARGPPLARVQSLVC